MKKTIYLAGDSTMQTYSENQRPQFGWGEKLLISLNDVLVNQYHRDNCSFGQETCYVGEKYVIDNCAMAGRSSKSFRNEKRLEDIDNNISEGDYFIIQFGHNDAGPDKPERYVPLEEFEASIKTYIDVAKKHGAKPILISSIILCPCKEIENTPAHAIGIALVDYAKQMSVIAQKYEIPYIDMGQLCREAMKDMSMDEIYDLYREDHVHLVESGANLYAGLVAKPLSKILEEY